MPLFIVLFTTVYITNSRILEILSCNSKNIKAHVSAFISYAHMLIMT